jgi:hypothetical protein
MILDYHYPGVHQINNRGAVYAALYEMQNHNGKSLNTQNPP